jgi:hypothetical protein
MQVSGTFQHQQSAHCESGVTSNLLRNAGLPLSEAMSFGLGSGLFFLHLPFIKVMGLPLTSYRSYPGTIFKKTCRRLGLSYDYLTFRDPLQGQRQLDDYLNRGEAVGLRGNIYWLPYIPEAFRFQFNAHSFVIYGRNERQYLVSDPVLENASEIASSDLNRSRFAKGALAPKGLLFTPRVPAQFNLEQNLHRAVRSAISETTSRMLFKFVPFCGIVGIEYLSHRLQKWPIPQRKLQLANVIRMQEEIGTGGAGFRFLYAAFLQEAGNRLNNSTLTNAAQNLTETGNRWRDFATLSAQFCKDRLDAPYSRLGEVLREVAQAERLIFSDLRRNYLKS